MKFFNFAIIAAYICLTSKKNYIFYEFFFTNKVFDKFSSNNY